jgi:hypothetical protein
MRQSEIKDRRNLERRREFARMAQTRRMEKATRRDLANRCAEVFALPMFQLLGREIRLIGALAWNGKRTEKKLVRPNLNTLSSAKMNRKQCFWLLALVVAVLVLNSCASEEGVAPAEGELSRTHSGY